MSKKSNLQPKTAFNPPVNQVKTQQKPESIDKCFPVWQFQQCDFEHEMWGWKHIDSEDMRKTLQTFSKLETMTWGDIKKAAGGKAKGNGTNNHFLPVDGFTKEAKNRLYELKLDDVDELFSLRLGNTVRIYGIRNDRVLQLLWYDRHHGSKAGAYPTKK